MWKVVKIHTGRRPFALEHSDGRMLRTLILRGVHRRDGAIRVWQDHPNAQHEADRLNEEQAERDRPKADQATGLQPGRLTQLFR